MKKLFIPNSTESKDPYLVTSNEPRAICIKIVSRQNRISSQECIFSLHHEWISKFISQKKKENPYKSGQHNKDVWAALFEVIIKGQIFHCILTYTRFVKSLMSNITWHASKVE